MTPVEKAIGEAVVSAVDMLLRVLVGKLLDHLADSAKRRLWRR